MGRRFYKMTGSGNDFVVFNSADGPFGNLETAAEITTMCARGTGIGADGAVFLEAADGNVLKMRYYNADGSRATLCGNASLCSTRLGLELGLVSGDFTLETDAGRLPARVRDGLPEIGLEPVTEVQAHAAGIDPEGDEMTIGFARVGVPHLIVAVPDLEHIDLQNRGAYLRRHPTLTDGANVNFVSRRDGRWYYRTYERGVEGETLACGSGSVATAILLNKWSQGSSETVLETRSGKQLTVGLSREGDSWLASLRGEGRIVFEGSIRELV